MPTLMRVIDAGEAARGRGIYSPTHAPPERLVVVTRATLERWLDVPDLTGRHQRAAQRRADVLYRRYVAQPSQTLAEVARDLGVTVERVRQMERIGLEALRLRAVRQIDALRPRPERLHRAVCPWDDDGAS